MPIRHCQKCSLKVLIDDSQANVSPFYCQRCTAALKPDDGPASVPTPPAAVSRRASSPNLTPVPATAAVAVANPPASAKTSTVKVFCPYCKASFNGRIPSKPARGSCPLCQKDLILLPTGDIRPAADFDLAQWQAEQASGGRKSAKESGTMAIVKKYAADPHATSNKADAGKKVLEQKSEAPPAPVPAEETHIAEEGVELPAWLDDESKRIAQKSPSPTAEPAAEADVADPVRLEDLDPVPTSSSPAPKRSPSPRPSTAHVPVVEAQAAGPKRGTGRRERTERRVAEGAAAVVGAPQGAGKFMLALLLTVLPLGACPILLSSKEKLESTFFISLGARFTRGFRVLEGKLFPVEEAAPPPKPMPKAPEPEAEAPAKLTADDQRQMEEEINKRWMEYKREDRTFTSRSTGATAAEKAEFKEAETRIKGMKAKVDELRANYRKHFGKDYDPTQQ
jgi:hypothetical protein